MSDYSTEYFYIRITTGRVGPLDEETFRGAVTAGSITNTTPVWRTGEENWVPFSSVRQTWLRIEGCNYGPGIGKVGSFSDLFSTSWLIFKTEGYLSAFIIGSAALFVLTQVIGTFPTLFFKPVTVEWAAAYGISELIAAFLGIVFSAAIVALVRRWEVGSPASAGDIFAFSLAVKRLPKVIGYWFIYFIGIAVSILILMAPWGICIGTRAADHKTEIMEIVNDAKTIFSPAPAKEPDVANENNFELPNEKIVPESDISESSVIDSPEQFFSFLQKLQSLTPQLLPAKIFWGLTLWSIAFGVVVNVLIIRTLFAYSFILDTGCGVIQSLKYSWQITRGHFWRLLAYGLFSTVLYSVVIGITLGLGQIPAYPILLIMLTVLYIKLRNSSDLQFPPSSATKSSVQK